MDQKIFQLGLAVNPVSAYLLCCALADEGRPVRRRDLLAVWNESTSALDAALTDLISRGILAPVEGCAPTEPEFRLQPVPDWLDR